MTIVAATALVLTTAVEARDEGRAGGLHGKPSYHHDATWPQRFDRRVDRRQARQAARIRDGLDAGELSRKELKGLRKDQQRIAHMERRFEADGYYSPKERRKLEKALDRSSRRIQRAIDHDPHVRRGHHRGADHGLHRGHGRNYYYGYDIQNDYVVTRSDSRSLAIETDMFSFSWSKSQQE
jgi:hypothetical protein